MNWLRIVLAVVVCTPLAAAADWPQWLGPNRDGSTSEEVAPWKSAPRVLWRQAVGDGYSSPVVAEGRVVVHARVGEKDEEEVIAFDARTGRRLWRAVYARNAVSTDCGGYGPRATPAVAGGRVYTHGISGVVSCFDAVAGQRLWQVDTHREFKAPLLRFGASCSPLVEGKQVIVQAGGKDASVIALDRDTGAVVWKCRSDPAGYASPVALGEGANRQIVLLTGLGLIALRPGDGELLWEHASRDVLGTRYATPVRFGDHLFITSMLGGQAFRLEAKEGGPAASPTWKAGDLASYISTPVAVGDMLYVVANAMLPERTASLRCVDAKTGKELWQKLKIGKYHAGLVRTGNGKLLLLDESGELLLLDPNPKEYRELARAKVCGPTMALPALADGKVYVRDGKEVLCLQLGE